MKEQLQKILSDKSYDPNDIERLKSDIDWMEPIIKNIVCNKPFWLEDVGVARSQIDYLKIRTAWTCVKCGKLFNVDINLHPSILKNDQTKTELKERMAEQISVCFVCHKGEIRQ